MNYAATLALAKQAREAVADLPDVVVATLFPEASTAVLGGSVAVLIDPPASEYLNDYNVEATYTLWVAGPTGDPEAAWQAVDATIDALVGPLDVASQTPAAFQPQQGPATPAYQVTLAPITYERP